ncbi:MAG: type I glyceraldehyde-3-phosphate dehydrogenase [Acidimicrobiales bacterium]|nr:MAG: glyceraldehyde-3-phosphate dehydrogenase [marine actinobacterium MedAcidi-G1]HAQ04375.1 type I glyceraldehyde-3-phosphate dehydrogenase [Acidimicrobiaceae bacterium]|tara:strand:+ start:964 stop:1965 length:1002 start_codon:yes stop_codon:yes gene_type:complete
MPIKIGINGFGRIGRNFYRAVAKQGADMEIVAVNDLGDTATMAHLLKHDSVHGNLPNEINAEDSGIMIDGQMLQVLSERNPQDLPWSDLGVDVVIESTGIFTDREKANMHLEAGAPLVIVSAPANGADATFVVGVNDSEFDKEKHTVISNASCTTNCFVPMVQVLDDAFGVEKGLMTTVHAYTGDQSLVDGPHGDLRRARASAVNIIPTSTGAARATGLVLQAMNGKLDGISLRVPIPDGSITDFTALLSSTPSADEINAAFKNAATTGALSKVLEYSDRPLVSSDIVGNPASCVFDSGLTMTMDNLVKISGWYDNEWGYSNRLVDLVSITTS